jgi:starch phosphorylase
MSQIHTEDYSYSELIDIAYFCMEYGLHHEFPIYSGGLGVLAGDHMKSAGDLRVPITGIGLLWSEGYTVQRVDRDGTIVDHYPTTPRDGLSVVENLELSVRVAGRNVPLRAYRVDRYITSNLYLLEPVRVGDRWITQRLYGGGEEDRLAQEVVLGVGGVRLLRGLGIDPGVYHFNEGHAVFAGLELIREHREAGASFDQALARVRDKVVFTTHTPVPAGNEIHPIALMKRMGAGTGLLDSELEYIGGAPFSMTVAGLRMARAANGVAQLHGETAREMWKDVDRAAPIGAITNGVHVPTWQDARIRAATVVDKDESESSAELWSAHQAAKRELLAEISVRTGVELREDRLVVGFARRAATYKRADLVFGDPERLDALFADQRLQFVFAGKAHPRDAHGKAMITRVVEATWRWPRNVVYLEAYDMHLGAVLTRGCDVWLNNPRRPMEASGTSGMKAAMNGALNVSILDGWWPEGCEHGRTGWQVGEVPADGETLSTDQLDARDREALYEVLGDQVLPRYYDDRDGWIAMMKASIAMSRWRFSSDRMIQDYVRQLYSPPSSDSEQSRWPMSGTMPTGTG